MASGWYNIPKNAPIRIGWSYEKPDLTDEGFRMGMIFATELGEDLFSCPWIVGGNHVQMVSTYVDSLCFTSH